MLLMAAVLSISSAAAAPAPGVVTLVVCAPGYPGSTVEAQPAMDTFAAAAAAAAHWQPGGLAASYFETEKAGIDRLVDQDAALALVPLPFWLKHESALRLKPVLHAVQQGGEAAEAWTLVAAKGAIAGPESMRGYEIVSLAGYEPRFILGPVLADWGTLPPDVTITFSGSVLTSLRRASAGNRIAVLLDRAQAAALPTLPFADKLEVITRSGTLPVSLLCVVGDRLAVARLSALSAGLLDLGETSGGAAALAGLRLGGFVPVDPAAITRARDAFQRVKS
jgi:hypothetical protein